MPLAPKAAVAKPSAHGMQTSNVVVRKVQEGVPKPSSPSGPVPKASGFVGKAHMAKEFDFDFDFDELEKEASKPPMPKAVPQEPAPVPKPGTSPITLSKTPTFDKPMGFIAKALLGKGQMGSALMNGVTAIYFCMFFDRGTFWVLPLTYFYLPKSARAYLFQSAKIHDLRSGPIGVDPICPQPNLFRPLSCLRFACARRA